MIADDVRMLQVSGPLFDGTNEFFRRQLVLGKEPA